jgi:hypothetical protein
MPTVKFEYSGKLSDGRFFDSDSTKRVVIELDDSDLTTAEMLEEFMNFLQAIGYKFEIGDRFDVVNDFKEFEKTNKVEDQPIVDESGTVIGIAAAPNVPF